MTNQERRVHVNMKSDLFRHIEFIVNNYETPLLKYEGIQYKITGLKPSSIKGHINVDLKVN